MKVSKISLLFCLILISSGLQAYVLTSAFNRSAGDILLFDYDAAVFKNNSFNAFRSQNTLLLSGAINKLDIDDADEKIQKMNGVLSITALKTYVNIDVAYNIFSAEYYSENILYVGLSRKIIGQVALGITAKYNSDIFKLTYENEYDPVFTDNQYKKNDFNGDISCSGQFSSFAVGLDFENILSVSDLLSGSRTKDVPFIIRINTMAKLSDFLIFKKNYTGAEIAMDQDYIDKKIGLSLGLARFFHLNMGTVLNSALTTGLDFSCKLNKLNLGIGYALEYMYEISAITHILSLKILY